MAPLSVWKRERGAAVSVAKQLMLVLDVGRRLAEKICSLRACSLQEGSEPGQTLIMRSPFGTLRGGSDLD